MTLFKRQLVVPVPRQLLYDWHMRDGAFERLGAPWDRMRHIHAEPVTNGAKRIFEVNKGGVWVRWVADHQNVVPGEQFTDIQERGPFKRWRHTHRFEALEDECSRLTDDIEYDLPMGMLGRLVAGSSVSADVERMFGYRHRVTLGDLSQHGPYRRRTPLKVAISGASGLLGRQLCAFLRTGGHEVLRFVRTPGWPADDEVRWSLADGVVDLERLEGIDAIIHLAGANVAQRWTPEVRKEIMDSRVLGTRAMVEAIGKLERRPATFVSASGVSYYGDTGDAVVDEDAPLGDGYLAEVCAAWETEAARAERYGCRTVSLRIGIVLDPRGGALKKVLPVFRAGAGGRVGNGEQLMSWISLDDVLGAMLTVLQTRATGIVNVCGPAPVSQAEFAATLGRVLSRPSIAPAPAAVVRAMYGEMADETALVSIGAKPSKLIEHDYVFRTPTLEQALRHCLGRPA